MFFGISPTTATGYSLFVVGVTALAGSGMYIRKGDVDFKIGLLFAIPSILGVNIARGLIIPNLPETIFQFLEFTLTKEVLIMAIFSLLMIIASYSMIKKRSFAPQVQVPPLIRATIISIEGLMVGLIAGFIGAGGGFLIIPALVLIAGLTMRIAIGTSLMIIALQSLIGFAGDVFRGALVNWALLGTVAAVAVAGILIGSITAHKISERHLKISFGWFVLVMGSTIFLEQLRHLSNK